jgi:hypothetical protein
MDDATARLLALGLAAAGLAAVAVVGDRRRVRRSDLDAVGFMPWTPIFFAALIVACVALGLAGRAWLAGR